MGQKMRNLPAIVGTMGAVEGAETMPKRRRPRKLTLSRALREATRGGASVAGAVLEPDGRIVRSFGDPETTKANGCDLDRELEAFERHHGES